MTGRIRVSHHPGYLVCLTAAMRSKCDTEQLLSTLNRHSIQRMHTLVSADRTTLFMAASCSSVRGASDTALQLWNLPWGVAKMVVTWPEPDKGVTLSLKWKQECGLWGWEEGKFSHPRTNDKELEMIMNVLLQNNFPFVSHLKTRWPFCFLSHSYQGRWLLQCGTDVLVSLQFRHRCMFK